MNMPKGIASGKGFGGGKNLESMGYEWNSMEIEGRLLNVG